MRTQRTGIAGAALACAMFALSGCAAPVSLDAVDVDALMQLSVVAPAGAEISGAVTNTECWAPTEHMLSGGTSGPNGSASSAGNGGTQAAFRVLCRVHYAEEATGAERYRDMICIGDLDADPVTDHCYRWAYYSDMPKFEDQPSYTA